MISSSVVANEIGLMWSRCQSERFSQDIPSGNWFSIWILKSSNEQPSICADLLFLLNPLLLIELDIRDRILLIRLYNGSIFLLRF